MKACGNPECSTSTGIHEGLTFGHGRLDEFGYWEFPCRACATAYDQEKEQRIAQLKSEGFTDEMLDGMDYLWVTLPGWPYDDGPYDVMPPDPLENFEKEMEDLFGDLYDSPETLLPSKPSI